jgi:hypothetical protein
MIVRRNRFGIVQARYSQIDIAGIIVAPVAQLRTASTAKSTLYSFRG